MTILVTECETGERCDVSSGRGEWEPICRIHLPGTCHLTGDLIILIVDTLDTWLILVIVDKVDTDT